MKHASKSILFLPLLQIPSGHHQVANALIDALIKRNSQTKCEKIDILSYSYGKIESIVSTIYLKWIQSFPSLYNKLYQFNVYRNIEEDKNYRLYEILFLKFIRNLIKEKQPSLIICTHALPSYMLNYLKDKKELNVPVINVYTDYFIHRFWGIEHIDFHFVPSHHMKEFLKRKGIKDEQIFTTGIPIHNMIEKSEEDVIKKQSSPYTLLITGGNLGVGALEDLIGKISNNQKVQLHVLCGKNMDLYNKLKRFSKSNIIPHSYISCRKEMNDLYDRADAILTKPGGVTVSESLFKRKPIFVYHALPGQEEINLGYLNDLGVIFDLCTLCPKMRNIDEQILSIMENEHKLKQMQQSITEYHRNITARRPEEIIEDILHRN